MDDSFYIYKLTPFLLEKLWGGTKLRTMYGKGSDSSYLAESWELSAHDAGPAHVCGGEYDGLTLKDLIDILGEDSVGEKASDMVKFPLLIKFINAEKPLSIQIHPNDEYAMKYEKDYGKNEMWYVIDAAPDAYLYYGLKEPVTKEELRKSIHDGTLPNLLCKMSVKKGDVFFLRAGTIHAIGEDLVLCEIQESSNITYRMFDYNRIDSKTGKTRELHIDRAIDVTDIELNVRAAKETASDNKCSRSTEANVENTLVDCEFFKTDIVNVDKYFEVAVDKSSFKSLVFISGEGKVYTGTKDYPLEDTVQSFRAGDVFFVPAGDKTVSIDGNCECIIVEI